MQMTEEKFQAMYSVRSLKDAECAKDFDCGDEDLNEFITQEAALYKEAVRSSDRNIEKTWRICHPRKVESRSFQD